MTSMIINIDVDEGKLVSLWEEPLPYIIIAAGVVIVSLLIIYMIKTRKKRGEEKLELEPIPEIGERWPFKVEHSVTSEEAKKAREDLKMLDLEREILSDAIRRLYEAHAEGKITEEERERLAHRYKGRMMKIKDAIAKHESLVALHELETVQEDLIKLFNERFDELNKKIEGLRPRVEVKPIKEVPIPAPTTEAAPTAPPEKVKKKARRRPKPSPRTEAEKRIEEIRAEVEKVLERLGQMEIEA